MKSSNSSFLTSEPWPALKLVLEFVKIIFLALLMAQAPRTALGQEPAEKPRIPVSSSGGDVSRLPDDRYLIGPGDILDIRVYNRPSLSLESVRVDSRGKIRMPLIDDEIQAACRTESELAG